MTLFSQLFEAAVLTLRSPREGAERIMRWPLPDAAIWPLVALSVVLSTLVAETNSYLNPPPPGTPALYIPPINLAIMLGAANVSMALGLSIVGRWFGGAGGFRAALILTTWQQFIWFGVLFLMTIAGIFLPTAAAMASLAFGIYMIWILICFAGVLHGLDNMLGGIILLLSSILAAVVMMILLGVFGVTLGEGMPL